MPKEIKKTGIKKPVSAKRGSGGGRGKVGALKANKPKVALSKLAKKVF